MLPGCPKYYHYEPVELTDLPENFAHLVNSDDAVSVNEATMDNVSACPSIDHAFKELDDACPLWEQNTQMVNPKWLGHHQTGHLVKDKTCLVCIEESGSRVERKVIDNQESCISISQHSSPRQMATSTALSQLSQLKWRKSPNPCQSLSQCRRKMPLAA